MSLRGVALGATWLLVAASVVAATSAGAPDQRAFVVAAGGRAMRGGDRAIDGSIGQPAAARIAGAGGWRLAGGFWHAAGAPAGSGDRLFANGFDGG